MKKTTLSAITLSAIIASFGGFQSLHAEETNPDGSAVTSTSNASTDTSSSGTASTNSGSTASVVSTSNPSNSTSSSGAVVPTNTASMREAYDSTANSMADNYINSMQTNNPDQSSMVADSYSTPSWSDENNSWGTSVVKGADSSSLAAGCDPAVSKGIMANQLQEIGGAKALAAQNITMPPQGIFDKLMQSGCLPGLGGSVSYPGLNQLKQLPEMLANQVCQAAKSMEQNYMAQYVTNPISSFSQNANVNLGSIGGYSLGSVPMGVQLSGTTRVGEGGSPVTFSSDAIQTARGLGVPNLGGTSQGLQAAQEGKGAAVHNNLIASLSGQGSGGTTAGVGFGNAKIIKSADGSMRAAFPWEE